MRKFKKTFNPNRIKINYSYTAPEIANLLGTSKDTILLWHKNEGLQAIDDRIPYIFHGIELRRFIRERQAKRKQKCSPTEFYCLKCRKPRASLQNQVSIIMQNEKKLNIQGCCSVCNTRMNRRDTVQNLSKIKELFCVLEIRNIHISGCLSPIVNSDSKGEAKQ